MLQTTERVADAKSRQQKLEQDFEDARKTNHEPADEASSPPKSKTADDGDRKAKPKTKAKTKAKASAESPDAKARSKRKADPEPEDEKYATKDSKTARSSTEPMPEPARKKQKPAAEQPAAKPKAKATSKANNTRTSEPTSANQKESEAEAGTAANDEEEELLPAEKKKKAHKLYMRFYRSVHSRSLRACVKLNLDFMRARLNEIIWGSRAIHSGRRTPPEIKKAFASSKYRRLLATMLIETVLGCSELQHA